ncbi:hypothetical protein GCM10010307_56500 [Streptomyces vastus]|uniref:Uncharacterized protein n=1 Tax=Streptomyces vastus TaxID=285451 RepID=A0ABN3RBU2_9ACTN
MGVDIESGDDLAGAVPQRGRDRADAGRQLFVGQCPSAGPHLPQDRLAFLRAGLPARRQPERDGCASTFSSSPAGKDARRTLPREVGSAGIRVPICTDRVTYLSADRIDLPHS